MIDALVGKRQANTREESMQPPDRERRIANSLEDLVIVRLLYTNHMNRKHC
jgi:hypothetical protein